VRIDYSFDSKDSFLARFSYAQDVFNLTTLLPTLPSGFGSGSNPVHPRGLAFGYTHSISPGLAKELRFGYTRDLFAYKPPFDGVPLAQQPGISNANRNSLLGGGALIGGSSNELQVTGDGGPYIVPEYNWQGSDSVSWLMGHHTMQFGANIIHREVDFFQGNLAKGYFVIGGVNYHGTGRFTGYEVSELLAGFTDYEIGAGEAIFQTKNWETGYYAQDAWRVSR
jgi:hypothetical protein